MVYSSLKKLKTYKFYYPSNPPMYLPIHLCIYQPIHVSTNPSMYLPTHPCIYQPIDVSTNPPMYLPTHPSIYQSTYVSTNPPMYLPTSTISKYFNLSSNHQFCRYFPNMAQSPKSSPSARTVSIILHVAFQFFELRPF